MYYLIYLSTAAYLLSEEELLAILQTSRHNNAALGITGMLLSYRGHVMQLLEEEKSAGALPTNRLDPLHKGLLTLAEGNGPSGSYPTGRWASSE